METQQGRALPAVLPTTPEECGTLDVWMELKLGMTQRQVADCAGLKQSRVSAVVNGHLPRKQLWPPLLKALQLENKEHEFYRMVIAARRKRERVAGLEHALAHPETLLLQGGPAAGAVPESGARSA